MSLVKFRVHLSGIDGSALLMHNARLSDPLDEYARKIKKVSGKRNKTEDDHREMADLEWLGGIYHDADLGPFVPGQNIERCLCDAAKKIKLGTVVKSALIIESNINALAYDGPRDLTALLNDTNYRHRWSAKVSTSRVMRTRPHFRQWATYADGQFDNTQIDLDQIVQVVGIAGRIIGLGDWRPRYGKFVGHVEQIKD